MELSNEGHRQKINQASRLKYYKNTKLWLFLRLIFISGFFFILIFLTAQFHYITNLSYKLLIILVLVVLFSNIASKMVQKILSL